VCGGSGSEFIQEAIAKGCQAFVTADLKYHTFQEYEERILLVDANHFETERIVLPEIKKAADRILRSQKKSVPVTITKQNTNPIQYYTSH
jgi:putative NIF3 family GTP cyclohydrolase 1 type 2